MTRTIDSILSRNLRRHAKEQKVRNWNPINYKSAWNRAGRQLSKRVSE